MHEIRNILNAITNIAPALAALAAEVNGLKNMRELLRTADPAMIQVVAEFMRDYRLDAFKDKIPMFFGERIPSSLTHGDGQGLLFSTPENGRLPRAKIANDAEYATYDTFVMLGMDSGGEAYMRGYVRQMEALLGNQLDRTLFHDHALPMKDRIAMVAGVARDPDHVADSALSFVRKSIMPRVERGDTCMNFVVHSFAGILIRAIENAARHVYKGQGKSEQWIQENVFDPMQSFVFGCAPVFHDELDRGRAHIPTLHIVSLHDMAMPRQKSVQGLMLGAELPAGRDHILTRDPLQPGRVSLVLAGTPDRAGKFLNVAGHNLACYIAACEGIPAIWQMMTARLQGERAPLEHYGLRFDILPPSRHEDTRVARRWLDQIGREDETWRMAKQVPHPIKPPQNGRG